MLAEKQNEEIESKQDSHEGVGKELEIYTSRFTPEQEMVRDETWNVLVAEFFSKYIKASDCVLDLGAGDGLFITKVSCRKKIAVDLSEHVRELEKDGVIVHQVLATEFVDVIDEAPNVIFMSNFLEHLPDKRVLMEVFAECYKALPKGGKVMILQPNIRYAGVQYWDYVDHHIALTEFSLVEGLEVSGFTIKELLPQFLPYTAKSSLGAISKLLPTKTLVSWYLRIPLLWKLFGAQTFVVAEKK